VAFRDTGAVAANPVRLVIIPKNAVQNRDGRDLVFVIQRDRAERRAVTLAGAMAGDVTISAGVSAGEKVVLDAPADLADGAAVKERNL